VLKEIGIQTDSFMSAGAKIGRRAPRERGFAAE